jgi:hypothetical protein
MIQLEMDDDSTAPGKQRLAVQLPSELVEKARDAVYWTPGMTLNRLAQIALTHTLECMESLRGVPFPPRGGNLPAGRQVQSSG